VKIAVFSIFLFFLLITCSTTNSATTQNTTNLTSKNNYDVIVVGGGLGGLSAAAHLCVAGKKVLLLEQHYKVGGCTTSFSRGEYNFDAALHEMSLGGGDGGFVKGLLKKAGVLEKIELIRVNPLGRSIFPGFEFVHPSSEEAMKSALKTRWPAEAANIDRFHDMLTKLTDEVSSLRKLHMANPLKALITKLSIPLRQRTIFKYRHKTVETVLDEFFDCDEIKAVLGQFWAYHGPPPSHQWSIIYLIAHHSYLKNGGWQIKGSSQALSNAYQESILEHGGKILTDTLVTKITLDINDHVTGVVTKDGEHYLASSVVSNADPYQTFFTLIGEDHIPRRYARALKKMKPSNSFAGVYLGIDAPASQWGVADYEIFLNTSFDEDAMYNAMMSGDYKNGLISVTVYSNLNDPFYAPKGKSVVAVHTYSSISTWPKAGADYERQKAAMMETLIDRLEQIMPDVREHIDVKVGITPRTMKTFTLQQEGSPYGFNFTVDQQERLPTPLPIGGLYLVGSWAWPAHGVGMVQVSGFMAAESICKKSQVKI